MVIGQARLGNTQGKQTTESIRQMAHLYRLVGRESLPFFSYTIFNHAFHGRRETDNNLHDIITQVGYMLKV